LFCAQAQIVLSLSLSIGNGFNPLRFCVPTPLLSSVPKGKINDMQKSSLTVLNKPQAYINLEGTPFHNTVKHPKYNNFSPVKRGLKYSTEG
jgi:hypothetical protein